MNLFKFAAALALVFFPPIFLFVVSVANSDKERVERFDLSTMVLVSFLITALVVSVICGIRILFF